MSEKSELALSAITAVLSAHPNAEAVLISLARIVCESIPDGDCIPPQAVNFLTRVEGKE